MPATGAQLRRPKNIITVTRIRPAHHAELLWNPEISLIREAHPQLIRLQEWLNMWRICRSGELDYRLLVLDGRPGGKTLAALAALLRLLNCPPAGSDFTLSTEQWDAICSPMRRAFACSPSRALPAGRVIVSIAVSHLMEGARELTTSRGPWVRAYMNGFSGRDRNWSMGFVRTVAAQAERVLALPEGRLCPAELSPDMAGREAMRHNKLIRHEEWLKDTCRPQAGDIFLLRQGMHSWSHAGIISGVDRAGEIIHTIEAGMKPGDDNNRVRLLSHKRYMRALPMDIIAVG